MIANGYNYDGTTTGNKIAKSLAATKLWNSSTDTGAVGNNLSANNSSGFSALPGGYRDDGGIFDNLKLNGHWWSSTEWSSNHAGVPHLIYNYSFIVSGSSYVGLGFSVRCVRD